MKLENFEILKIYFLFLFKGISPPLNIPTPTPAPGPLLGTGVNLVWFDGLRLTWFGLILAANAKIIGGVTGANTRRRPLA